MLKRFNEFITEESKMHDLAVHAYSLGGDKFKVHKVGPKVKQIKVGDEIRSSDLDDLGNEGHKVKEINRPKQ